MKGRDLAPLAAIAVILLGLSIGSLVLPDRDFSPNENRYLQAAPALTAESLFSGTFTAQAEKYTADQIALRDTWITAASVLRQAGGKQDIGGVWLGEDGYYFTKMTEDDFDRARYEKNLTQVQTFFAANDDKDCRILLAPTPAYMLADKLPDNAVLFDADACYDTLAARLGGAVIDSRDALGGAADQIYYRTDHHWTTAGAYAAYTAWCGETGHTAREWPLRQASDSFRGTLYSKVLLPGSAYDDIFLAEDAAIVSMDCDGAVSDSLYDRSRLAEKDQYTVFMGGNHAKAVIQTRAGTGRSLLVVKDSFANSFLPFLTADYDTITVLDLRYCRENVQALAEGCTDVLVLYELTNFAGDNNLFKLNSQ